MTSSLHSAAWRGASAGMSIGCVRYSTSSLLEARALWRHSTRRTGACQFSFLVFNWYFHSGCNCEWKIWKRCVGPFRSKVVSSRRGSHCIDVGPTYILYNYIATPWSTHLRLMCSMHAYTLIIGLCFINGCLYRLFIFIIWRDINMNQTVFIV